MKIKKILLCAVMIMAAAALFVILPVLALGPVSGNIYDGIDVSEFQGDIDFAEVRRSGIDVVYIRAGEGSTFEDPNFDRNAANAEAAGLRFGFYLFVTAESTSEAEAQADFFVGLIRDKNYDCRPAMDFESFGGLSTTEVNEIGLAFMRRLESLTGITPVIYTDAYAADTVWSSDFGRYPLWAADYGASEPDIASGIWDGWSGFQYSDEGSVSGISGNVDLDRFTDGVFVETPIVTTTAATTVRPVPTTAVPTAPPTVPPTTKDVPVPPTGSGSALPFLILLLVISGTAAVIFSRKNRIN